jgi:hypothetical protein
MIRDLINTPANDMGPDALEAAVLGLSHTHGARVAVIRGDELIEQNYPLIHAVGRASAQAPRLIDMHWGDARFTIRGLEPASYDIVFLDAFSTQRNSQLWTFDFFRAVHKLMKPNAILATYCAALPVRGGLMRAGFHIGESTPVGRKRSGTVAAMRPDDIVNTIDADEMGRIRNTTRGLPYRDPRGYWSNSKILRQRELARKKRMITKM